jgi:hypothetical protein
VCYRAVAALVPLVEPAIVAAVAAFFAFAAEGTFFALTEVTALFLSWSVPPPFRGRLTAA